MRPGLLLASAIGDGYGAGFEFATPEFVAGNNDLCYHPHPLGEIKAGRYTDDTQMAIGLTEFLLQKERTPIHLARHFVLAFKRDPRHGYNGNFYKFLSSVRNGTDFLQRIRPNSDRSGGAMRAAPCGMLPTLEETIDMAMWQASITHATRDGMNAAAAVAALVWACRQGVPLEDLPFFLEDTIPGYQWDVPWQDPVPNKGVPVVSAVLTVLTSHTSVTEMLKASVAFTGDVDTVAALVLAAASQHPDAIWDLRHSLFDQLEADGKYGVEYLDQLDDALEVAYPKPEISKSATDINDIFAGIIAND